MRLPQSNPTVIPVSRYRVFLNREIRRVPLTWQHPQNASGTSIPLLPRDFYALREIEELRASGRTPEDLVSSLMPDFDNVPDDQLGLCVYETTTEGTPVSPVFPDTAVGRRALVRYCAVNVPAFGVEYADPTIWAETLFGQETIAFDPLSGRFETAASGHQDS